MKVEAIIETTETGGFRVRNYALGVMFEAPTREGVIAQFEKYLDENCRNGREIVSFDIPREEPPWMRFAGDLRDDPMFDEWVQIMKENRAAEDNEAAAQ